MPMDSFAHEPRSKDYGLNRATGWQLKLCWFSNKCFISGKSLWGKRAYHGTRWIHGPGKSLKETYWIDKHEFLIWQLKR